jgi:diaminopimelate epimerase
MVVVEKYHGTGNDFVVVAADADVPDRRELGRVLCDRETGIAHPDSRTGADGVLVLELDTDATPPRVDMTLVQPDGSIAAMCGNGARVAAAWAAERTGATELIVDADAGPRPATIHEDGVTISMGDPTFAPDAVPLDGDAPLIEESVAGVTVTAVNTGVPHAVSFVESVDAVDLESIAPPVRYADVFPEGANLTIAAAHGGGDPTDPADGYDQRTYERGVEGETRSCGTGAVAIAAVAHRLGYVGTGEPVSVRPPGGELLVTVTDDDATLRGPVTFEYETTIDPVALLEG